MKPGTEAERRALVDAVGALLEEFGAERVAELRDEWARAWRHRNPGRRYPALGDLETWLRARRRRERRERELEACRQGQADPPSPREGGAIPPTPEASADTAAVKRQESGALREFDRLPEDERREVCRRAYASLEGLLQRKAREWPPEGFGMRRAISRVMSAREERARASPG